MKDCPTIDSRVRDGRKVDRNVSKDDAQATRFYYAHRTRGEKPDGYDDKGKSLHFFLVI